jgi:hypothetical protein
MGATIISGTALRIGSLVIMIAAVACLLPTRAEARRQPSRAERNGIALVIGGICSRTRVPNPPPCHMLRAFVSTVDPRFAWADVVADAYTGTLLKRPRGRGGGWHAIANQGGGVVNCSNWYSVASHAVVNDLRLGGLKPGDISGHRC